MDLNSKTVIVTGGGTGIGRALALEFGRNGANVVCCGRRIKPLQESIDLLTAQGGTGLAIATDITRVDQVSQMVERARKEFGPIDILFNNAGSFQSIGGVHEVDPKTWWRDVEINLLGSLLCIRAVLPEMLKRDAGIIINMNGGRPVGGSGYACGKAGLMELTRVLSEELKLQQSHVMVFGAGPGLVLTEMTQLQADSEAGRKWIPSTAQAIAAGNLRKPEEIAKATIGLLAVAEPRHSGESYNPDTDFSKF